MQSSKVLKFVVAGKIILLLAIWISMDDRWQIGDKPATAAESPADVAAVEAVETPAAAEKPAERSSFLSNLLDLPKLDSESIKKAELGNYLEMAERKKRQVEERLTLLQQREEQLKGLEQSIEDKKLRRLDDERKYFAQTIQKEKELKGKRLDKLITFYRKMEPKKAAPMFEQMDKDLVVSLFKEIPQKQITLLLEQMDAAKSVELSEYFGRVRSAREYDLLKEMNQSLVTEFEECKGMKSN